MDIDRRVRKRIRFVLALFLLLGAAIWGFDRYFVFAGRILPKDAVEIDLSGQYVPVPALLTRLRNPEIIDLRHCNVSPEDYERLCSAFPGCEIRYELPFQGSFLPLDTETVTVSGLSNADVKRLRWLKSLRFVDAADCRDYDCLMALRAVPGVEVNYNVAIGEQIFPHDSVFITVMDGSDKELRKKLRYLPEVKSLELGGTLPGSLDGVYADFPNLNVTVLLPDGRFENPNNGKLNLSQSGLNIQTIRKLLRLLPGAQSVQLPDCLQAEDVCLLFDDFSGRRFLWDYPLYGRRFSTAAGKIDLNGVKIGDLRELERSLQCFPDLKTVEMCDCGIENETMAALNRRHESVRFIWKVKCGALTLRTDARYLMPTKLHQKVYDGDLENLRYCPDIICVDLGHMPITDTSFLKYLPKLQYLVLADTHVKEISGIAHCKELVYAELFMTDIRDVSPLARCPKLEDLNLCYTYADPAPVRSMKQLKRLWWSGFAWKLGGIRQDLPDTQINLTTGSSTGGGWREGKRYYEMRDILGMNYMKG